MAIDKKAFTKTKHSNIKIHKDGIKFWFDFTINKVRYSRLWNSNRNHTKADKLRSAVKQLEVFRSEVEHQESIEADTNATVNDYWDILVKDKGIKKDKNGKIIKDKDGKPVRKWSKAQMDKNKGYYNSYIKDTLGSKRIKDVKPAMFTQLNRTISHLATRTQKMAYELLIPIFKLAIESEIIDRSPIKSDHVPKRNQLEEKKVVTKAKAKYKAVYEAINKVFKDNPHHRAIFLFGFYGRRKTEVLKLQWQDIDFDNDLYTIRASTSKINIDLSFKLPEDVKEILLEFAETEGNIFEIKSIVHQYHQIRKEPGVPPEFTFHWMRNLSVSALSAMGAEATHLSSMLGHQDAGTLKKYLSLQREASTKITNALSQKLLSQGGS